MKKGMRFIAIDLVVIAGLGCASSGSGGHAYFRDLAEGVMAGDERAFRQVLALADSTPPGARLEELAELSSRFVRLSPAQFLAGQATSPTCFGVSFMGPDYVDNPDARARERQLRRQALESVNDPALESNKQRCLAELAGN